jgi:hypothetical protein
MDLSQLSDEELAKLYQAARYPTPSQRRGENMDERVAKAPEVNNPIASVMRGGVDVLGGGAQFLSRGANALGLVPPTNPGGLVAGPQDVDAQNTQARANIDQWFGKEAPGFNPVRAASGAALTLPLAPAKFLEAPTLLGRSVGAGTAGAVAGALQEVQNPGEDFWKKKGARTAVGFGAGAIAQPIAEGVVKYVVGGLNNLADKGIAAGRELTGANSTDKVLALTREALGKSGINFDAMSEAAKQGLLNDVQAALGKYSGVNQGAIARNAAFREEGFTPLRHWISKDPGEFTAIENLSHTPVGDPLKQKQADLNKLVMDRLNTMRGPQPGATAAGTQATSDLKGYIGQQEGKTNVLYGTFGEIAPNVRGDPQRFANDVFGGLEGQMALGSLPPGIAKIVNEVSKGNIPLTPSMLYQLQKMGNAARGADGSSNYALGHLSRAIDREMAAISQSIGTMDRAMPVVMGEQAPNAEGKYAADVLKMARGQHAKVQGELEQSPVLAAVNDGKLAPENFTDKFLDSSIKDVASTWTKLGEEAKAGIRAQVLDDLKRTAFGGSSDASGKAAAQQSLNNYLSDPATASKLRIVLGNDGMDAVKRLALMLESAKLQPAGSAVNNSKTGGALLGDLTNLAGWMKAKGLPGGTAAQDTAQRSVVQAAQVPVADALGQRSLVIDPAMEEILKRRAGQFAGLLAGGSGYQGLLGMFPQPTR